MKRWAPMLALSGALFAITFLWVVPGPISIDEVTYQRMTRDLAHGRGFELANGYEDEPSLELATKFVKPTPSGHLAAQYPYGQALLGAVLYRVFGARSLFLIDVIAFLVTVMLTFRIARQLTDNSRVAVIACVLLCCTFATEYALASWPHATSTAAVVAAFALARGAWVQGMNTRRAVWLGMATGAVLGLGATFRLDVLLCVPALAAPFLLASPTRTKVLGSIGVGLVPGFALLVLTNHARWGSWSPLSYGPSGSIQVGRYVMFALIGAFGVVASWAVSRRSVWNKVRPRLRMVTVVALAVVLVGQLLPAVLHLTQNLCSVLFDLRIGNQGEIVGYYNGFKRALLQSAPVLVIAVVGFVQACKRRDVTLIWLGGVPGTLIAFYGVYGWHGGLAMNMRYLVPTLPFLSILAALALAKLLTDSRRTLVLAACTALAAVCYLALLPTQLVAREHFLLSLPLVLALLAAITYVRARPRWLFAAAATTGLAVGWTVAATVHDTIWSQEVRGWNRRVSTELAQIVPSDSLLFGDFPDPFYDIQEMVPGVRIAVFTENFGDAGRLAHDQLGRGKRVFAAVSQKTWDALARTGALANTKVTPIGRLGRYFVGEIEAP